MRIAGIIDVSTVDVPKIPVIVLFVAGCNFDCPFCHNYAICRPKAGFNASVEEIAEKLGRNIVAEGVNISGGEPTIQADIIELVGQLKERGMGFVGMDSNGSQPKIIKQLAMHVNRFAIDFKAPWEDYGQVTGSDNFNVEVQETMNFLGQAFQGDLEFRTTIIREFHSTDSLVKMARYLQNLPFDGTWVLQQYQFSRGVNPAMKGAFTAWNRDEMYEHAFCLQHEYGIQ
ncbi:MAG TPA: anaerobic ribonucleoside-triphosphate reductase activating protein, partial [Candidatus Lokiarchaeia archaeon]|nr:anaerobic ribonucleoside-triphosphate reductase activating protein [Candidatus Lokiarchaeia archaeon]